MLRVLSTADGRTKRELMRDLDLTCSTVGRHVVTLRRLGASVEWCRDDRCYRVASYGIFDRQRVADHLRRHGGYRR